MRSLPGVLVALLFLINGVCYPQEMARVLYDQGKYEESLQSLQKNGLRTAADFYNAGNALFRLGKVGQALAHYLKADAMAPGNSDIRHNLDLTVGLLNRSGSLPKDQSFWSGTLLPLARRVPEAFADILLALVTLGLAALSFKAKRQSLTFVSTITQPVFLGVLGLWALSCAFTAGVIMAHRTNLAAVVADIGVARSGPNATFTELFKLPAGTTVELTGERREGWQQIRFSLGNIGWIMDKDLLEL